MRFSATVAALAAVAPLVSAHGSVGMPKIAGLHQDVKAREILGTLAARFRQHEHGFEEHALEARQSGNKECGDGKGSCGPGECCSRANFCGTTADYCYSPGCKYKDGPGCPENNPPKGSSTSNIPRTKYGKIAYGGTGIYHCVTPGTVALTYDDGPYKVLTDHILGLLKKYNAKATFFVTGNNINKGQIDTTPEYVASIKRMDAEGHQIASHTWTHLDLSKISSEDRKAQMYYVEMAIRNIIGKIPTYMRPPYSSCTGDCEKDMADLGYHVTYFNVDTDDYNQPKSIEKSQDWFKGNITKNGNKKDDRWLTVNHDIVEGTAYKLTEFMLKTLGDAGYKAVTVGECLGDPKAYWYRNGDGSPSVNSEREKEPENYNNNSTNTNTTSPTNGNNQTNTYKPGEKSPNGGGNFTSQTGNNRTGGGANETPQTGGAKGQVGSVGGIVGIVSAIFAVVFLL